MIEVKNLKKNYGDLLAVDDVNFVAQNGKITVLLGPNGAGKSTTIKSICGLLKFNGEVLIDGYDNTTIEAKKYFGYVPEVANLYDNLTVKEHIDFIMKAYDFDDEHYAEELLELFDLKDKKDTIAKELSKGMKQKVSMILALLYRPSSLMVDEPMIGLDPKAIENTLKLLMKLKDSGSAILISTHIIDMIDHYYDEAYIMDKGKIKAHVIKDELKDKTLKDIFFEVTEGQDIKNEELDISL